MSFFETSRNVSLDRSILRAQCETNDGSFRDSSIDLNSIIGNIDGNFVHPGNDWFDSAEDQGLDGRILRAKLVKQDGSLNQANINLDGFIANDNGTLKAI